MSCWCSAWCVRGEDRHVYSVRTPSLKWFVWTGLTALLCGLMQMAMLLAFRPTTLGMLTALGMLWVYVLHVRRDEMNVLGVRLGVRTQAIALLVLTLGVVFFLTNAAAMLSSVCSAGVAVAVAHSALRKPQQDIQAEAEGDGTLYKGFTSFVESNLSNEALSKVYVR
jgi:hypothetical protein